MKFFHEEGKNCCFRNILAEKLQKSYFRLFFFMNLQMRSMKLEVIASELHVRSHFIFFHKFSKVAFSNFFFVLKSQINNNFAIF